MHSPPPLLITEHCCMHPHLGQLEIHRISLHHTYQRWSIPGSMSVQSAKVVSQCK